MPIRFDTEKNGWILENATDAELEQLREAGLQYAGMLLGLSMLKKYHAHMREAGATTEDAAEELMEYLKTTPGAHMGQT